MPHALVLLLCLLVCGCAGGTQSDPEGASETSVASEPCVASKPHGAAQRDSTQILVVIGDDYDEPAGQLAVARHDGGGFRGLTRMSALEARWSPDGERIAFIAADNFTRQSSLWVMRADGRDARQLVPNRPEYSYLLEWSPDGGRILYDRGSDLWSIRVDGSDKSRLAGEVEEAVWSPDGRSIAFVSNDEIHMVRADGSDAPRVVGGGVSPRWAADGNTLVYLGALEGRSGVYAVGAGGGEPRRVVAAPETGFDLADVSPDGCSVLVGDAHGLATVSLDDGTLRRLTRDPDDFGGDWSPDGRRIAFLRGRDLWVVRAGGGDARLVREAPAQKVFAQATWKP